MSNELKPCNHCGGDAIHIWRMAANTNHCYKCGGCGLLSASYETKNDAIAAWNRCDPESVTSVVRWMRYDGTPETLPEEGVAFFLVCNGLLLRQSYSFHSVAGQHEVVGDILPSPRNFKVGDLWAYLPQPPEGAE